MSIKAVLIAYEGEYAILRTKEGEKFTWPKSKFPDKVGINTVLSIAIRPENDSVSADNELAKEILNEILNTSQNEKI